VKPDIDTFTWHLQLSGNRDGQPLLWLHGFMGSSTDWAAEILPHFSDYCNICADLPGHGRSALSTRLNFSDLLERLQEQLQALSISTYIPIGYSMGGRLAFNLLHQFPETIPALISLSSAPGLKTTREQQDRRQADAALMDQLDQIGWPAFLEAWYQSPLFAQLQTDPARLRAVCRSRAANDPRQLRMALELLGNGATPLLGDKLAALNKPVLLLNGALDDKYCQISHELLGLLPQASQAVILAADHAFHLEKPLETVTVLKHFLSETI